MRIFEPMPQNPGREKENLDRMKETIIKKLLAKYESIVVEAKKYRKNARGLELLEQAEKELDKIQKVKKAKTLLEAAGYLGSEESLEQESAGFSAEHLKALDEVFGPDNLKRVDLFRPKGLTPEYFDRLYPKRQRPEDEENGLISFRRFWERDAREELPGYKQGTKGQAIMRSMRQEAAELYGSGTALYAEAIQKPNPKSGTQKYGSAEGIIEGLDGLDPIMKQCFGERANRFGHSYDELYASFDNEQEKFNFLRQRQKEFDVKDFGNYVLSRKTLLSPLKLIEQKIVKVFKEKGLSVPSFRVMLEPALVFNRQTTEQNPGNSRTFTDEITSTPFLTEDGKLSGYNFAVGARDKGGASQVDRVSNGSHSSSRGFRVAILLLKEEAK